MDTNEPLSCFIKLNLTFHPKEWTVLWNTTAKACTITTDTKLFEKFTINTPIGLLHVYKWCIKKNKNNYKKL